MTSSGVLRDHRPDISTLRSKYLFLALYLCCSLFRLGAFLREFEAVLAVSQSFRLHGDWIAGAMGDLTTDLPAQFVAKWSAVDCSHLHITLVEPGTTKILFEAYTTGDVLSVSSKEMMTEDFGRPDTKAPPVPALADSRTVQVEMISGEHSSVQLPPPHKVSTLKAAIEKELKIPTLLQRIVAGEELKNDDLVEVEAVTLLRRDAPPVSNDEFFVALTSLPDLGKKYIIKEWYEFDTCEVWTPEWTEDTTELLAWLEQFRTMQNEPLSVEAVLKSMDTWLATESEEKVGKHPEAFVKQIADIVDFMNEHVSYPSLLLPYAGKRSYDVYPVGVCVQNDNQKVWLYLVGRLRHAPSSVLIGAVHMDVWC